MTKDYVSIVPPMNPDLSCYNLRVKNQCLKFLLDAWEEKLQHISYKVKRE